MSFFELASCLAPAVPGGYSRAHFIRELISMFTNVTEDGWNTRKDPSKLPTNSLLEPMASHDSGFSKKLATAICSQLCTGIFIDHMNELDIPTQEFIVQSISAYDKHIDLQNFAYEVTALFVDILYAKTGLTDKTAVLKLAKIEATPSKCRDLLLVYSRGCAKYTIPLWTDSHDSPQASYSIVFLDDVVDPYDLKDFAVLCKPCAECYMLTHTADDIAELRDHNHALNVTETVAEDLLPLELDSKIAHPLTITDKLSLEQTVKDTNYDVAELTKNLNDMALLRQYRDLMGTYEAVVHNTTNELEAKSMLDLEMMRYQIGSAQFAMCDSSMFQYEIWQRLTIWLHEHTHINEYSCGIIVSFMIHICGLFKPSSVLAVNAWFTSPTSSTALPGSPKPRTTPTTTETNEGDLDT